jgi:acetamidase/formamidase
VVQSSHPPPSSQQHQQRLGLDSFHYKWSQSHGPAISIKDGDTVTFEINDVATWQLTNDSRSEDISSIDPEKFYPLTGPVLVEEARPGDALVVEVVNVVVSDFGWSAIIPGMGLLEEFTSPYLYRWDLSNKEATPFEKGIQIPLRPFCGVLGVAPPEQGEFDVMPPGKHGGNLDIRHLTAGSKIKIPVWVDGALFSVGDVHAAMGDGEVCVCAIECAGEATLRFTLERGSELRWPQYLTGGDPKPRRGYYATTGIASDLMAATKESVRNMLDHLTDEYDLTREEAYVLCSVAADVRVHEVVDRPNWVVGTMISRDIFPSD